MKNQYLFLADGQEIFYKDFCHALEKSGAGDAEILFIHTDMTFGQPNTSLSRRELMENLLQAIQSLGVKTLLFPTFTFSFPNGKIYDVTKSKSKMGALNEFVRKKTDAVRSIDPLMSTVCLGEKKYLVEKISHESVGEGCTMAQLHNEKM